MSYLTVGNIVSSFQAVLTTVSKDERSMDDKTKQATLNAKKLLADRKTMVAKSPQASSALDSALYSDVIETYAKLRTTTESKIDAATHIIADLTTCLRKHKVVSLLSQLGNRELPPECVFLSNFTVRSRSRTESEHGKYVAACVRVGGEYAIAMRRGTANNSSFASGGSPLQLAFTGSDDKVFPEQSRDEFILDRTYPLVGFEDIVGNTHAVFLTGLSLSRSMPDVVPAAEPNSGLHEIVVKGYRVAKIPALCLFNRAEDIPNLKFVAQDQFYVPAAQPMDEVEHRILSEAITSANEAQKVADEAPDVEQKVYVHEFNNKTANVDAIFSLTAIQADEIGNSWCNVNASRSVKSGGFSGEKDGFDALEMNDISCFSDCIDVSVNTRDLQGDNVNRTFPCCISIESGRRLFEANASPFTRKDAEKFSDNLTVTASYTSAMCLAPTSSPSSACYSNLEGKRKSSIEVKGMADARNQETDNQPSQQMKNKTAAPVAEKRKQKKQPGGHSGGFCKFKMDRTPQEVNVVDRLAEWNKNKYKIKGRDAGKNSWWCSLSPPLKIEDVNDEEEQAEACMETATAVRTADILSCMSSETEAAASLHRTVKSAITKTNNSTPKAALNALKEVLEQLDDSRLRHPSIWSEKSMRTARGLLVDEATASLVAQQISKEITRAGLFEGICNNTSNAIKSKYEGQRKYASGNKAVSLSTLKPDGEREIDVALKRWVTSKLPSVPAFPNVFSTSSCSAPQKRKRTAGSNDCERDEPRTKKIKSECPRASLCPNTTSTECHSMTSSLPSSPQQEETGSVSPVCDYVYISPPSFIKSPRINNGDVADNLADVFGRSLCGMKNSIEVYQCMCAAVNRLKEMLIDDPFSGFDLNQKIERRIFDNIKAEEVERAAMEVDVSDDEDSVTEPVSVLDYEAERFDNLLSSSGENFKRALEESRSWCLGDNIDHKMKVAVMISNMRRVFEECYAYKKLACIFVFNMLKKELEGDCATRDSALTTAFGWYCAVVARNRICDMFGYVPHAESDTQQDHIKLSKSFIDNLDREKLVVSLISGQILQSLHWMMNTEIPSGFLKGLWNNESNECDRRRLTPCVTIDETARFVVPELNIGSKTASRAVRVGAHVLGPIFVKADFSRAGLSSVKFAKLFINSVTGNGLLTISPRYDQATDSTGGRLFPLTVDILSSPELFTQSLSPSPSKAALLSTFSVSPSRPRRGASKGGHSLFDKRSFQNASGATSIISNHTPRGQITKKQWCDSQFEESRDMWRCGFVLTKKMCEIIFKHRGSVVVIGEANKKSKITNSLADMCLNQSSKETAKVCKSISRFTKCNPGLLAKNIEACSPSDIDVKVIIGEDYHSYVDDATTPPLVTCCLVREVYGKQLHSGLDNYCSAFFNFCCRSVKFGSPTDNALPATVGGNDGEKGGTAVLMEEEVDNTVDDEEGESLKKKKPSYQHAPAASLDCHYVCDVLQNCARVVNCLRRTKSKHVTCIKTYRKKVKQ